MQLIELLTRAVTLKCSDVYLVPGAPPMGKSLREMVPLEDGALSPAASELLLKQVYAQSHDRPMDRLLDTGDDDFSFFVPDLSRFRCSAYKQRGSLAAVLRVVPYGLPDPRKLNIPEVILDLYKRRHGLILVTGAAGSGKTTTLACIIDRINHECHDHIITVEDPIEFLHSHVNSIVSQRELTLDTESYGQALRAALRQAPDVILLGEMRDYDTIQTALTAAETGHLVLSTLHTIGAATTIDRIIDVFPANRQQQVRVQLSMALSAVVSQQLLPGVDGGMLPAYEIMIATPAIQNMIREGKAHQMDNVIFAGGDLGMVTMDADILRLYRQNKITKETALLYAVNPDVLGKRLST